MTIAQKIDSFLAGAPHAVVGASTDRTKYGNRVLRAYLQAGRPVHPVNPKAAEVEGLKAFPDLRSLPEAVHGISVITPPAVTEKVVEVAAELGIRHVWMQPGAESDTAVARAEQAGINVIADGSCALIVLGFQED
ncbi:MAG: CoA-binding protein [Planctomycetota bacterium]|jgi:predicted CoA-binding protein